MFTCRSFISFSARSLSAVSASSSWEADSPVFRSSVSSDVSSVIWDGGSGTVGWGRCQGRLVWHQHPLSGPARTYPALQAVAVEPELVTLFLHLLEFALQLLDLFLQQSRRLGGGRRKGKRLAGRSLAGLCTPPVPPQRWVGRMGAPRGRGHSPLPRAWQGLSPTRSAVLTPTP